MSKKNILQEFFQRMWIDYLQMNPTAKKIHDLLTKEGNEVVNDHIALRTFQTADLGVDTLSQFFKDCGYVERGTYRFEEKKLMAKHFEFPEDASMPKVFISELILTEFSQGFQQKIKDLIQFVKQDERDKSDFLLSGRPWPISKDVFYSLKQESEYGAWLAAIGFRPNHFTVSVNGLKTMDSLQELNKFLEKNGFQLNDSGGKIKGSPEVYLEQSSTLADSMEVEFSDGVERVSTCYYEFAKRYPGPDGQLYQGFVSQSADKIFESTERSQNRG